MIYRTGKGQEYDIGTFAPDETEHLKWLVREYLQASSWMAFHQRTAHGTISFIQGKGEQFETHPLYWIQLDLAGNAGVALGQLTGKTSWMFLDDEGKQIPLERIVERNLASSPADCLDEEPPPNRRFLN